MAQAHTNAILTFKMHNLHPIRKKRKEEKDEDDSDEEESEDEDDEEDGPEREPKLKVGSQRITFENGGLFFRCNAVPWQ